ncbi:MAG TPA: hypothetical protein VLB44_21870, partial [Kofleriaceae bacterium]|nr:hypothetical protein [Kofleriaceae bacterium]
LMRASRRLRKRLQWFVECIRIVFDEQVLRERAEKLLAARSLDSPDKLLAYASAIDDRNLRCRLENKAVVEIIRSGADPSVQLDLENEDKHLEPIVDRARAMHELRRGGKRAMELARSYLVPLEVKTRLMRSGSSKPFPPGTILEMLSDAVEAGVVPSLPDIRRGEELSQILTIVPGTYHAAVFVIVAAWFLPYGDIPPGVVDVAEPSCATAMVLASGVMGWSTPENAARARILFHRALELDSSAALTSFVDVCTQMPRAHVRDLHRALEDEGLVEAWAPLYEALRSIAEPDRLDALAPEMRAAAKAIAATFKPA